MEDLYTGLLNKSRELKLSRRQGEDDDERDREEQPPTVPDQSTTARECTACLENKTQGYTAACCGGFVCDECMTACMVEGDYSPVYFLGNRRQPVCAHCRRDVADTSTFLPWVPQQDLPVTPVQNGPLGTDAEAWNFTVYHGCGMSFVVAGWSECDVLAGGCPQCKAQSVSLSGAQGDHAYELRGIGQALAKFHKRSSPKLFAELANQFPNAWRTLRLAALVDAIEAGERPDLSLWNEEAVEFLILRAADIKRLLG